MSYTPLDHGIIHSSVWSEPHATKVVWVTLLSMADAHDEVMASVPGLAAAARATLDETETALRCFLSPDPYSRTPDYDGRRIEAIPGGWFILNRKSHRERASAEHKRAQGAQRARRHRKRNAKALPVTQGNAPITQPSHNVNVNVRTTNNLPARKKPRGAESETTTPRITWLTPYVVAWESKFGANSCETMMGQMAKALKPHHDQHGPEVVARRLAWYLTNTEARFASVTKFAQTFGQHDPDAPGFPDEQNVEYVT